MDGRGLELEEIFNATGIEILNRYGITLTTGTDFDAYREFVAEARPDHKVGAPFDHRVHDMSVGKATWTIGRNEANQIVYLHAMRLLPTGSMTLAEYFQQHFLEFPPSGVDVDFERSRYRPGPGAQRIKGRVAYMGESWIGGTPGQYRGTGISGLLGRFGLLAARREFSADYVVGFMAGPVAHKGFSMRMGYMHAEPLALSWAIKNEAKTLEGVMVYMSDDDTSFLLDVSTSEIEALVV